MKELACCWHCSPSPVASPQSVTGEGSAVTFTLVLVEICNNKAVKAVTDS